MGKHVSTRITIISDNLHSIPGSLHSKKGHSKEGHQNTQWLEGSPLVKVHDATKNGLYRSKVMQPTFGDLDKDEIDSLVDLSIMPYAFHLFLD